MHQQTYEKQQAMENARTKAEGLHQIRTQLLDRLFDNGRKQLVEQWSTVPESGGKQAARVEKTKGWANSNMYTSEQICKYVIGMYTKPGMFACLK